MKFSCWTFIFISLKMLPLLMAVAVVICGMIIAFLIYIGRRPIKPKMVMAVIGSGGHTAEMLTLVKSLTDSTDTNKLNIGETMIEEIIFVASNSDQLSLQKLHEQYPQLGDPQRQQPPFTYRLLTITRSRSVHQSYFTSVFTTLVSLLDSFKLIFSLRPQMLLCNGPGVCIPLVFAARLLSPNSLVIFVESFCRTQTLSLSGKIIYHLRLADHFLVQWPKLVEQYDRASYLGGTLV